MWHLWNQVLQECSKQVWCRPHSVCKAEKCSRLNMCRCWCTDLKETGLDQRQNDWSWQPQSQNYDILVKQLYWNLLLEMRKRKGEWIKSPIKKTNPKKISLISLFLQINNNEIKWRVNLLLISSFWEKNILVISKMLSVFKYASLQSSQEFKYEVKHFSSNSSKNKSSCYELWYPH